MPVRVSSVITNTASMASFRQWPESKCLETQCVRCMLFVAQRTKEKPANARGNESAKKALNMKSQRTGFENASSRNENKGPKRLRERLACLPVAEYTEEPTRFESPTFWECNVVEMMVVEITMKFSTSKLAQYVTTKVLQEMLVP